MSSVAIFSDLHLRNDVDEAKYKAFLQTFEKLINSGTQEFWLLGDIFDVFIGPFKFWNEIHKDFFYLLETCRRKNIKVIWLEGNHDFFIKEVVAPLGVQVHDGHYVKMMNDKKVFLSHGDLVDVSDEKYFRWRAFTRNKWSRRVFRNIPEKLTKNVVLPLEEKISRRSRKLSGPSGSDKIKTMFRDYAQNKIQSGYHLVCLGHSHVFDQQTIEGSHYLNLGFWNNNQGTYATWRSDTNEAPEVKTVTY